MKLTGTVISGTFSDGVLSLRIESDKTAAARWAIMTNTAFLKGGGERAPIVTLVVSPPPKEKKSKVKATKSITDTTIRIPKRRY